MTQGARYGVELPGDAISDAVFAFMFAGYYAGYRLAEQRFPHVLKLLGAGSQPVYEPSDVMNDTGEHDEDQ